MNQVFLVFRYDQYLMCDSIHLEILSAKTAEELAEEGSADKYFNILEAACESKSNKLMEIGLDAIHFLIGNVHDIKFLCIFV